MVVLGATTGPAGAGQPHSYLYTLGSWAREAQSRLSSYCGYLQQCDYLDHCDWSIVTNSVT